MRNLSIPDLAIVVLAPMAALVLGAAAKRDDFVLIDATPQAEVVGSKGFSCQTPCRMPTPLDNQILTFKWNDHRQIVIAAPRVVTPDGGAMMFDENAVLISTPELLSIERLVTDASISDNPPR